MAKKTKKLYVWTEVLADYTDGIVFALADSEEQARATVARESDSAARAIDGLKPQVFTAGRQNPVAFVVHGGG